MKVRSGMTAVLACVADISTSPKTKGFSLFSSSASSSPACITYSRMSESVSDQGTATWPTDSTNSWFIKITWLHSLPIRSPFTFTISADSSRFLSVRKGNLRILKQFSVVFISNFYAMVLPVALVKLFLPFSVPDMIFPTTSFLYRVSWWFPHPTFAALM